MCWPKRFDLGHQMFFLYSGERVASGNKTLSYSCEEIYQALTGHNCKEIYQALTGHNCKLGRGLRLRARAAVTCRKSATT